MDIDANFVKKAAKIYLQMLKTYFRAKFIGLENIPKTQFLAVGNHLGVHFMPETFLWMTKYHSMNLPVPMNVLVHHVFHKLAAFFKLPEKEFGVLEASPENAIHALKTGNALTVYPGGDRENTKPFKDRYKIDFFEHTGYIELAIKARVPILPIVGIGGGETLFVLSSGEKIAEITGLTKLTKVHSWPVYWSFPFGWHMGHLPNFSLPLPSQITISILPPYSIEKYSIEDANNAEVLKKINGEITQLMQTEMNRLAKGRIPIIGKI